jgi:hypothetical protein
MRSACKRPFKLFSIFNVFVPNDSSTRYKQINETLAHVFVSNLHKKKKNCFCILFQAYLEFFTRKEVVDKLLEVLKTHYPTVSYHVVDHKVSKLVLPSSSYYITILLIFLRLVEIVS